VHSHSLDRWRHQHLFLGERHARHERKTWFVVALTAAMMIAEIIGGHIFGSMALVADGWHMSTHAAALTIAGLAYWFARKHAHDPRFTFGTGKMGELTGFASAIVLGLVALLIGFESAQRIHAPVPIAFNEAIAVAVIGLAVNLISAMLLWEGHGHEHGHDHGHRHGHADSNLRAAYLHVLADALTSILAIVGLLLASLYGWVWIDPAVGIVGAVVIASWSISLIRSSSLTLLDMLPDATLSSRIKDRLEAGHDRVSDLHLWRLGPGHFSLVVSIVTDQPHEVSIYKARLEDIEELSHVTVEVQTYRAHAPSEQKG
jgi:cation diffusion facilitator family transporter